MNVGKLWGLWKKILTRSVTSKTTSMWNVRTHRQLTVLVARDKTQFLMVSEVSTVQSWNCRHEPVS